MTLTERPLHYDTSLPEHDLGEQEFESLVRDLIHSTECAAINVFPTIGQNNKYDSDLAAVHAFLGTLASKEHTIYTKIGEGEKDKAPHLNIGEHIGPAEGRILWMAVDPLEGTQLTADGMPGAICTLAVTEVGGLGPTPPDDKTYIDKLIVPGVAKGKVSLDQTPTERVHNLAAALDLQPDKLNIVVLKRDRNQELIDELRSTGANVIEITDGDLLPCIAVCDDRQPFHAVMGIGGTPEGYIAAPAIVALRGHMEAKFWPKNQDDIVKLKTAGIVPDHTYTAEELAPGKTTVFCATAVTNSAMGMFGLEGVTKDPDGYTTQTLVITNYQGQTELKVIKRKYPIDQSAA